MNFLMLAYVALLFVLLTPGVLLRLPSKGTLLTVAIVHGIVFALVFHFTHRHVYRLTSNEGFEGDAAKAVMASLPPGAAEVLQKAMEKKSS
jgi:hypothetical protein